MATRMPPPPEAALTEAVAAPLARMARTLVDCRLTRQEAIALLHRAVDATADRLGWAPDNPDTKDPT